MIGIDTQNETSLLAAEVLGQEYDAVVTNYSIFVKLCTDATLASLYMFVLR